MNSGVVRNLIGMKFGRLTVLDRAERPKHLKSKRAHWLCRCECGKEKVVIGASLISGRTISCGCFRSEQLTNRVSGHKLTKTRFFRIWRGMKRRCTDPKNREYHNYGGRGIKVSEEWFSFDNFKNDMYDSYLVYEKENGKNSATLDRIDSNKDYMPSNCRWASSLEQARNRRDNISVVVNGVQYRTLTELAEAYKLDYHLITSRYKRGKRGLDLIASKESTHKGANSRGIEVEVNGIKYESITALQKDYSYISKVSLTKRFKRGLRGDDLIRNPKIKKQNIR